MGDAEGRREGDAPPVPPPGVVAGEPLGECPGEGRGAVVGAALV